jgi:uncharacterized protein
VSDIAFIEPATIAVARRVADRASQTFNVSEALLFGSRARGDFHDESDADLAIVLRGDLPDRLRAANVLADIAFDVLLETGVLVSPLPLTQREMEEPSSFNNPRLIESIRRDGIAL